MTTIPLVSANILSLFNAIPHISKAQPQDRTVEAIGRIKELIATRATLAQKSAATAVINAVMAATEQTAPAETANATEKAVEPTSRERLRLWPVGAVPEWAQKIGAPTYIGELMSMKRMYDYAPQAIEMFKHLTEAREAALVETTDPAEVAKIEHYLTMYKVQITKYQDIREHFPEALNYFNTIASMRYTVSGTILKDDGEGNFAWGVFTVKNSITSEIYYSHNGDGNLIELDGVNEPYMTRELP